MKFPEEIYSFLRRIILFSTSILIFSCIYSCKKEDTAKDSECLLIKCEIIRSWNAGIQIDTLMWEFEYDNDQVLTKYINHDIYDGYDYVEEYYFFYNDNGKILRIDEYDAGYFYGSAVFTWNNNVATMELWWNEDDTLEQEDRMFEWEFNSQNEVVRLNDYMDVTGDEVPELWEYWKYYYENGGLVKIEDYVMDSPSRTLIYTNDDNHNPLSETHLGWFFDFDLFISKNNFLTEEIYHPDQNQPSTTKSFTYEYNEQGYPVKMTSSQISPSFTIDEVWRFEYDCDSN